MVGVPGRSRGCNTCIQRKIKCDQETPRCGNCLKSNRLCTGYKRRLGYVLSRDVNLTDLAEPNCDETTVTYQGRWRKAKSQKLPLATYQVPETLLPWAKRLPSLSLCRQVSTDTALRQQFHYIFLNDHFPAEMLDKSSPESSVPMQWLLKLRDAEIQSPALESCAATFFAARVGRKNNDMDLVHQSRSMYVSGLERVQRALSNPKTQLSDETLAACMALLLYEFTERPKGASSAYLTHQKGAMMLLLLRGPDASALPLGHSLFLQLRAQTIIETLIFRRETFLSRPEWIERPWKFIPKTPLDEVYDALYAISAIFQQFDELSYESDQTALQDGLRDVIANFLKVESTLQGLYGKFEKSISGPLYWPELSTLESRMDDTILGKVFPVSFHFPAFVVAQGIATYWSGMMTVHNQLMYAYDKLARIELSITLTSATGSSPLLTTAGNSLYLAAPSDARSHEHCIKWGAIARNICQSAEYFLQDKMGELGSLLILTLLIGSNSCMINAPEDWSREIIWIAELIGRVKKKFNVPT